MPGELTPDRGPFLRRAEEGLSLKDRQLLQVLNAFTTARLRAACEEADAIRQRADSPGSLPAVQAKLHAFLRESWEALDGVAREINLCMYSFYPDAGLYPPHRMTRQCGVYMVRKILRESPLTRQHPLSRLLWESTRTRPDTAYRRLSLLYNVSLFAPLPLPGADRLPGTADVPEVFRPLIKDEPVEGCPLRGGLDEMERWVAELVNCCYRLLAEELEERGG